MNRNDAHKLARILQGPVYNGNLVNELIDAVERAERARGVISGTATATEKGENDGFYRGKIGIGNTQSTPATSRYDADNCVHCHASYGHKASCPVLNREVAEARSCFINPSDADRIHAHALGISL